ncbi:heterokaryon incompatibility protein-domain-containing protein [Echria macrotheca]|uniref:Heterokaryon incompatibility protein-domain-containing protein n=1 Tax=Echria macrotheca TaxID=438768 RepID=A0AAJ0B3S6_9PEZI|nr:heterokaryon incompatibility protein-domain-containing protein [Echria macrotheca]
MSHALVEAPKVPDCPACLKLDYARFTDFAPRLFAAIPGAPKARYRLARFSEVRTAGQGGCATCKVLQQAIDHFWLQEDAKPKEIPWRRSWRLSKRHFEKVICLAQQPGSSLVLFKVVLYDDIADKSSIHTLTIRDATSRIELYRDNSTSSNSSSPVLCPAIGPAAHVETTPTLERAVALAQRWMSLCDATHPKCAPASSGLPKRLVDVRDGVKLVDTLVDEHVFPEEPYATLSHCWGGRRAAQILPKTTHDTLYQHRQGIDWASLPQLFKDVVLLTRALGFRYIWIDSLCIIQDDQEDWMVESTKMADVYQNAILNIAATSMRNASASLFQPRVHGQGFREFEQRDGLAKSPSQETIRIDPQDGPIFSRISHDRSHEVLYGDLSYFRTSMEPLFNRAWVFQERLLCRRTLHFAASELLWECRTDCFCECSRITNTHALSIRNVNSVALEPSSEAGDSNSTSRFVRPKKVLFKDVCEGPTTQPALDFWLRAVEEYSFLYLTRESDRPIALAGIAKQIKCDASPTYLAGLWRADLARALLWAPYPNKKVARSPTGAPTWSWMSRTCLAHPETTMCAVRYKHVSDRPFLPDSRLQIHDENTFCEYEHDNPFGAPLEGRVSLSAAVCRGTVQIAIGRKSSPRWTGRNDVTVILESGNGVLPFLADRPGEDPNTVRLSEPVVCALIGSHDVSDGSASQFLLVLFPVPGQEGLYERIGFSEVPKDTPCLDDAEVERVTII